MSGTPGVGNMDFCDEMGLGFGYARGTGGRLNWSWEDFYLRAVAMICKLLTEKVVVGLLQSILWGNTLEEWVNVAQNTYLRMIGTEGEWNPSEKLNSVPHHVLEIQTTPPLGHPALTSAVERMLVVTIPSELETFKSVIDRINVSNGSRLSLWVQVWIRTELSPNWRSGSSIHLNCPLGYS